MLLRVTRGRQKQQGEKSMEENDFDGIPMNNTKKFNLTTADLNNTKWEDLCKKS